MSFLYYYRLIAAAARCRKTSQGKHLHSHPLPAVTTSNIGSVRYSELQSDDEDDEINEKEKPSQGFPPTKENPYNYDDEHIYEYAQPK